MPSVKTELQSRIDQTQHTFIPGYKNWNDRKENNTVLLYNKKDLWCKTINMDWPERSSSACNFNMLFGKVEWFGLQSSTDSND